MFNSIKARTPILVIIMAVFGIGYTFAHNKVVVIPLAADSGPQAFSKFDDGDYKESVTTDNAIIRTVKITAPADGTVVINSSVQVAENTPGDGVRCSITTQPAVDTDYLQAWSSAGAGGGVAQLAGTRGFNIVNGQTVTYNLVCRHKGSSGKSTLRDPALTATFTPSLAS